MPPVTQRAVQTELFGRTVESAQWRAALLERLEKEGEDKLADRLRRCGLRFNLYCRGCRKPHEAAEKCNRKWCPSCGPKRANERAAKMRLVFRTLKWPLQITFTVPNTENEHASPLLLRELMASFRRLRSYKIWKENVRGGVVSVEITDKGNGLHPHLHTLVECQWLALKTPRPHRSDDAETLATKFRCAAEELNEVWQKATRQPGRKSLWIRRCNIGAVDEVLKYALKSDDALKCQNAIGPVLRMLDSVRTVATFGCCHGLKLPPDEYKLTCECGGTEWSPAPPAATESEQVSAAQIRKAARDAEFDAKMAVILAEEAARVV